MALFATSKSFNTHLRIDVQEAAAQNAAAFLVTRIRSSTKRELPFG